MKFHPNSIEIAYVVYKISTPRNVGTSRKQKSVNNTIQRALSGEVCNDDPNATVCCSLNSGRAPACGLRATRASGAGVPSRRVNAHACTRRRLRPVRERRTRARQPPRAASPRSSISLTHTSAIRRVGIIWAAIAALYVSFMPRYREYVAVIISRPGHRTARSSVLTQLMSVSGDAHVHPTPI